MVIGFQSKRASWQQVVQQHLGSDGMPSMLPLNNPRRSPSTITIIVITVGRKANPRFMSCQKMAPTCRAGSLYRPEDSLGMPQVHLAS